MSVHVTRTRVPRLMENPDYLTNKPTKDIKEFINYKLSALKYMANPVKIEADLPLEDLYLKES